MDGGVGADGRPRRRRCCSASAPTASRRSSRASRAATPSGSRAPPTPPTRKPPTASPTSSPAAAAVPNTSNWTPTRAATFITLTTSAKRRSGDELNVSLWVKANRPGIQLLCRVVLPQEHDPQNLDQPLTTLIKARRVPDHRPLAATDASAAREAPARAAAIAARRPEARRDRRRRLHRPAGAQRLERQGRHAGLDRRPRSQPRGRGASSPPPVAAAPGGARQRRSLNRRPDVVQLEGKQLLRGRQAVLPAHHPPHRHAAQDALRRRLQRHRPGRNLAARPCSKRPSPSASRSCRPCRPRRPTRRLGGGRRAC